jgi:phosphoglycolate phosphatase-like HAD superfamily hydrolase
MSKLVLFDIDGTLVLTGGAGVRAMMRAFEAVMGVPSGAEALKGIPVAGRTDWIILHDALARMGHQLDEPLFLRLRESYIALLRGEILQRGTGVNATLPGVVALLDSLHARDDVFLGLLTGNFKEGAQIKLERFDLWRYFVCGAFGDDAADRNALVPVALDRATACGLPSLSPSDVIVVGDTPHDVACAHAVGAVAVGVATGSFSVDQLRACGAAAVFETLENTEAFERLLGDGTRI